MKLPHHLYTVHVIAALFIYRSCNCRTIYAATVESELMFPLLTGNLYLYALDGKNGTWKMEICRQGALLRLFSVFSHTWQCCIVVTTSLPRIGTFKR